MTTFHYAGNDAAGRKVKGLISADSARSARDRLRDTGISVRRIRQRSYQRKVGIWNSFNRRRLANPLTEFIRELTTLLQAGVPLLEAIDCCMPQVTPALQSPLVSIRDRVAGGANLADAMADEAWLFDDMIQGMVRVGEHAGNLEDVLDQVANFREQSSQLQDKVISAVMYPAIVFMVSIAVTLFLMTVVVPMLLKNLSELGSQLPWPTRTLKFMSDSLLVHGWWLALVLAAASGAFVFWLKTYRGAVTSTQFALRLPVLGNLIRKQSLGRVALVVACLLRSGVELVEALSIASQSCRNIVVRNALVNATQEIERGISLRDALARQKVIPPSVAQIFALGQQSGQLEGMLQRLGTDYDRQASVLAGRVTAVAEPALILMLSVIVGFIMFATVLPILEAGNVLTG